MLTLTMLVGPLLVLMIYYKVMFAGLSSGDALDFAQIGRNLSSGRGFVTFVLRPLALTHGDNPLRQPDITHGPLYPFILALVFGIFGAKDTVVAAVSGFFYLVTVPVVYQLGTRIFNRSVGTISALLFTFNALMLEYATSGLPITLYVFLTTALLLTIYTLAAHQRDHAADPAVGAPRAQLFLAGALAGLLYLTEPIFFWVMLVVMVSVVFLMRSPRPKALGWFLMPLCLLVLPWMGRNWMLSGNPVFGLRGMELWMNTKDHYPGYLAYRMTSGELIPGVELCKAVAKKLLVGIGQVIQALPNVTASWVLAFLIPGLLFRFSDPAANTARRVMISSFLAVVFGTIIFGLQLPLFTSVIPAMFVFAIAYLLHLLDQAKLSRASTVGTGALITLTVLYPLGAEMLLQDRPQPLRERAAAQALGQNTTKTEVCISDQPWIVAWLADRPCIWIPSSTENLRGMRDRFADARWLFLTESTPQLGAEWSAVYSRCYNWNVAAYQALQKDPHAKVPAGMPIHADGDRFPLSDVLKDFLWLRPAKDVAPTAVIATVPQSQPKVGKRSDADAPLVRSVSAGPNVLVK